MPRTAYTSPRRARFDDDIDFPQDDITRATLDDPAWDDLQAKLIAPRVLPDARSSVVRDDDSAGKLYTVDVGIQEPGRELAPEIGWKRKTEEMLRLDRLGVTVHVRAEVVAAGADGVRFVPHGGVERLLPADAVLAAGGLEPDTSLHDELVAGLPGVPVAAVGDLTGLGLVRKATEDAARAVAAWEEQR